MFKNAKKVLLVVLIILIILIIFLKIFKVENIILKNFYPTEYSEYVSKYSKENELDELLIYSLIKAESNFDSKVVSSSKAVGLMQLMEATAKDVAKNVNLEYNEGVTLYEPEENIKLGTKYLSILMKYYNNNFYLALAAYNAGIGTVATWIEKGIIKSDGSDIENIPYKETNLYIRKILSNYRIYKKLYENKEE